MSSSAAGPPAVRFSQVLRRLVQSGDSRGIIRLVERWLEHGGVTQAARMAEARAFMDLCLMDRAWVRLYLTKEIYHDYRNQAEGISSWYRRYYFFRRI